MVTLWMLPKNLDGSSTGSLVIMALMAFGAGITAFFSLRGTVCYLVGIGVALILLDGLVFGLFLPFADFHRNGFGAMIMMLLCGSGTATLGFLAGLILADRKLPKSLLAGADRSRRRGVALPLIITAGVLFTAAAVRLF